MNDTDLEEAVSGPRRADLVAGWGASMAEAGQDWGVTSPAQLWQLSLGNSMCSL